MFIFNLAEVDFCQRNGIVSDFRLTVKEYTVKFLQPRENFCGEKLAAFGNILLKSESFLAEPDRARLHLGQGQTQALLGLT